MSFSPIGLVQMQPCAWILSHPSCLVFISYSCASTREFKEYTYAKHKLAFDNAIGVNTPSKAIKNHNASPCPSMRTHTHMYAYPNLFLGSILLSHTDETKSTWIYNIGKVVGNRNGTIPFFDLLSKSHWMAVTVSYK